MVYKKLKKKTKLNFFKLLFKERTINKKHDTSSLKMYTNKTDYKLRLTFENFYELKNF